MALWLGLALALAMALASATGSALLPSGRKPTSSMSFARPQLPRLPWHYFSRKRRTLSRISWDIPRTLKQQAVVAGSVMATVVMQMMGRVTIN
jgi:hypothetical protein